MAFLSWVTFSSWIEWGLLAAAEGDQWTYIGLPSGGIFYGTYGELWAQNQRYLSLGARTCRSSSLETVELLYWGNVDGSQSMAN